MQEEVGQSNFYIQMCQLTVAISALHCAIHYCGIPIDGDSLIVHCSVFVWCNETACCPLPQWCEVEEGKRESLSCGTEYPKPLPSFV